MVALTGDYVEVLIPRPDKDMSEGYYETVGRIICQQLNNPKGEPVVVRWKED